MQQNMYDPRLAANRASYASKSIGLSPNKSNISQMHKSALSSQMVPMNQSNYQSTMAPAGMRYYGGLANTDPKNEFH